MKSLSKSLSRSGSLLVLVSSCALFAQVGGPSLGLVPDSGSIRGIYGIPAAGAVGSFLESGQQLALAEISPTQNFALATDAGTGAPLLLTPASNNTMTTSTIAGASAAPDRIIFGPSGTSAVLWFSPAKHAQVIVGLPQSPSVKEIDASSFATDPAALAISDDGQWLLGAWAQGVYALSASAPPILLPANGPAQAVGFFHGKSDVAILTADQVTTVADIAGKAVPTLIWSAPPGSPPNPQTAAGFGVSGDNTLLTIVGNLGGLATFNLITNTSSYVDCACAPKTLAAMGGSLYRLTGVSTSAGGSGVKLYDAATASVWSVPLQSLPRMRRPIVRSIETKALLPSGVQPQ